VAALILCSCICAAIYFCCIKKDEENNEPREVVMHDEEPMPVESAAPQKSYAGEEYTYADSYVDEAPLPVQFAVGDKVQAQYIDGTFYDATVEARDADGTYKLLWHDGSQSEGVPAEQIRVA